MSYHHDEVTIINPNFAEVAVAAPTVAALPAAAAALGKAFSGGLPFDSVPCGPITVETLEFSQSGEFARQRIDHVEQEWRFTFYGGSLLPPDGDAPDARG